MRRALIAFAVVDIIAIGLLFWHMNRSSKEPDISNVQAGGSSQATASEGASSSAPAAQARSSLGGLLSNPALELSSTATDPDSMVLVEGRVEDKDSGKGLSGVEVYFSQRSSVVSGPGGAFRLELAPGVYRVSAAGADVLLGSHLSAIVKPAMEPLVVPVVKAAIVTGTMTTADGAPVTDATISFESQNKDDDKVQGISLTGGTGQAFPGTDGSFRLSAVPGQVTVIGRSAMGRTQSEPIEMKSGQTYEVDLVLGKAVNVRGNVTDASGRPVAGATVHLHPYGMYVADLDFRTATTDESGRYVIEDAYPGNLAIEAYAEGKGHAPPVKIALQFGQVARQDFRLEQPQTLSGRVVLGGKGLSTRVRAHRGMGRIEFETESDSDGRFTFDDLAPGKYWLQAYRPDGSSVSTGKIDVPASDTLVKLDKDTN